MHFRLVPKSMTLDDLERRIQELPKVFIFKYPLLSRERVKLRPSNLAGTFTIVHLNSEQTPIKNFGENGGWA